MSRRLAAIYLAGLLAIIALVGVGAFMALRPTDQTSQPQVSAAASQAPNVTTNRSAASQAPNMTTNGSASPEWLAAGDEMVQARATAVARNAKGELMYPNTTISMFGPYLTDPVDITKPGDYVLSAGPLRVDDSGFPTGFAVPLDVSSSFLWSINPIKDLSVMTSGGQKFVHLGLHVTKVTQPYSGLRIWVK